MITRSPGTVIPAVLGVLSVLFACLGTGGCATLQPDDFDPPEIELVGLRPISASGMEARFEITLKVLNPNAVALDVEGLYFEVFLRDRKVLSGASSKAAKIPAYGEGTLALEAGIGVMNSVRLIRDLAEEPARDGVPYTLKTKLSLGNLPTALRLEEEGVLQP